MSLGNLKTSGQGGKNTPFQRTLMEVLVEANSLLTTISAGTSPIVLETTKGYAKSITDTTLTEVLPGAGAGLKNYINQILVTNASTTVGTIVDIIEETTGDIIATGYASPEGGFSASYPTAQPQSTANKKIYAQCTTTGASVTVSVAGYIK